MKKLFLTLFFLGILAGGAWVAKTLILDGKRDLANKQIATPAPTTTPSPSPTPSVVINELPITLPMLDALFFVDPKLSADLKTNLQLTDQQVAQLRQVAREETTSLQESDADSDIASTTAAGEKAATKIAAVIGADKARQFAEFVLGRWQKMGNSDADTIAVSEQASPLPTLSPIDVPPGISASPAPSPAVVNSAKLAITPSTPFSAPTDTRIVVNAPAHRMDIFENGQIVKSYLVGIGYPEFPLPTGMRKASQIIFNPTWTAPDEPWVESSSKVKVGEKIGAGEKLNPLGLIKIPIGLPSLIHGGKQPAKIGGFASHGCVGLTDKQVQSFAKVLAQIGGAQLTDEEIAKRAQNRKETKVVKLKDSVPVELRYETLMVEGGKLHIYRDVYDRGTNVQTNLETLLATYGVTANDLSENERTKVEIALSLFNRSAANSEQKTNETRQQMAKELKSQKEIVIEIAALAGKGYPAPSDLDTGSVPQLKAKPAKKISKK